MKNINKPTIVKSHDIQLDSEYTEWIHDIKERYRNTQIKAAVKVNSEQLLFNWMLGRELVLRKAEEKWGSGIVEQVSLDLQAEFPKTKGFSARNLWFMKQWYEFYTSFENVVDIIKATESSLKANEKKLKQVASEIDNNKRG